MGDMKIVASLEEIQKNTSIFDGYIENRTDPEYTWALERIKKGTCFVTIGDESSGYKFYPSRFVGNLDNNMDKHEQNTEKDGRITNRALTLVFGKDCTADVGLEEAYKEYCHKLGFEPSDKGAFGVERKYWKM